MQNHNMVSSNKCWRVEEAIAGNSRALEVLRELVIYPFLYSEESKKLGLKWPRGLLLYGPPGIGKTTMVQAVVRESDAHLIMINPYSVHGAHVGEGEKYLREAFSQAYSYASLGKPSVIFIDQIDAICPRRNSRREHGSRIVGQLLTPMDGNKSSSNSLPHIVVVTATNRVDAIDPALRRPGRFDSEIEITVPTAEERLQILEVYGLSWSVLAVLFILFQVCSSIVAIVATSLSLVDIFASILAFVPTGWGILSPFTAKDTL